VILARLLMALSSSSPTLPSSALGFLWNANNVRFTIQMCGGQRASSLLLQASRRTCEITPNHNYLVFFPSGITDPSGLSLVLKTGHQLHSIVGLTQFRGKIDRGDGSVVEKRSWTPAIQDVLPSSRFCYCR